MTVIDDPSIGDDDIAYRRVHPEQVAEADDGSQRVSSAAFKVNKQDELALSVYLASVLPDIPVTPADCVLPGRGHTLAELDVSAVRSLEHGVVRDPVVDPAVPNPCDPAHALITGFSEARKTMERQARALAEKARWPS